MTKLFIIHYLDRSFSRECIWTMFGKDERSVIEKFLTTPGHQYGQTIVRIESEPIEGTKYVSFIG